MRTIVHLSDLHFGRIDYALIEPLVATIHEMRPSVVAVSGDLTQRARSWQFEEARRFLDRLPTPQLIVPGNHDVPLHNVFARFLRPLDKYRFYITPDLEPFYADSEIAIAGINTARSLTRKNGRINENQIGRVRERLCSLGDEVTKIVVTHHPFDLPEGIGENELVGRAAMAMAILAGCGADLLLAGHLHLSHTGHTAKRYKTAGHSALVVQAGTPPQRADAAKPIPSTAFASRTHISQSSASLGSPRKIFSLTSRLKIFNTRPTAGRDSPTDSLHNNENILIFIKRMAIIDTKSPRHVQN